MADGRVEAIQLHRGRHEPMAVVGEASAEAGKGSPATRACTACARGTQITFVSAEDVAAAVAETGVVLEPLETRRNVVTRGVVLAELIGRRFRVGEAVCEGIKPCAPCHHLEAVTRPGVRVALSGRGGLRADIVKSGLVRAGDPIEIIGG